MRIRCNMEKERRKVRVNPLLVTANITGILCLICCIATLFIMITGNKTDEPEQEVMMNLEPGRTYTAEEVDALIEEAKEDGNKEGQEEIKENIKDAYMNGTGIVHELRLLFPNDIVFYNNGKYQFVPISNTIPARTYDPAGLVVNERGEMEYLVNGQIQSVKGIDLSRYQGEVDWALVAADGVDYAMIRVGIRGYGTGEIVIDDTLDANMMGASYNGIDIGAYFFTQATSEAEAIEEADAVIEALAPYNITYPVAIDVEDVNDSSARTANLTAEQRTDYVIAFCERIEAAGYTPMIYGNLKTYCDMLDMERLNEYEKWFAFYDTYVYFPYEISMWQYTDSGVVNGIDGNVDLNITFTDKY